MAWPENVTKADLRIDYYRGSGPGGQNRNKRDTACRITHIPTGIASSCETQRSQKQNREEAFRKLADKLIPMMKKEQLRERYGSTERVRTYHQPQSRVTDHRLPGQAWNYDKVLDGELGEIISELALNQVKGDD